MSYGLPFEDIVATMFMRMSFDTVLQRQMISIRDRYNAVVVIPVTDTPTEPTLPPLAPQIIHDGIEHTAMRAAMSDMTVFVPPLDPGKDTGVRSREYAAIRRNALYASWHFSNYQISRARTFRQLCGYGAAASIVVPDFEAKRARIEVRDALTAYPDLRAPDDFRPPRNVGFVYGRSLTWLKQNYPDETQDLTNTSEVLWDVVEWVDEECIVVGVLGPRDQTGTVSPSATAAPMMAGGLELRRWPNRAGMVPVSCPRRVTLDTIAGQMDSATGMADWMDRLMTLSVLAAEKGTFADMYVLSEENQKAELSGQTWKDGRTGEVNILTGAKAVGQLVTGAGPMTLQMMDRIERAGNRSTGIIPQYGGENTSGLRTGRAIETMGSFSVDPRIKELQEIHAASMSESINPGVFAVEHGYWPNKKFVVFSGKPNDTSAVEYVPAKHFESHDNVATYSFPGMEASEISVNLMQLVGAKMMSRHNARVRHPMIDDPEGDEARIVEEELTLAFREAVATQVAGGQLPIIDYATILKLYKSGMSLEDAALEADRQARARQAGPSVAPAEEAGEMPEGAPGMPGLAMPGQGAEAQGPPQGPQGMPGPAPDQQRLAALLGALRAPAQAAG